VNTVNLLLSMLFLMGLRTAHIPPIPSIKQSIDRKVVTIGDRMHFRFDIFSRPDAQVIIPENQPSFGKLIVKNRSINTVTRKMYKKTMLEYELVSYNVGKDTIPALKISIKDEKLQLNTLPVYIEIKAIAPQITGKEDVKGLKPQLGIRIPLWYYPLAFFCLIAMVSAIIIILIKRRKRILEEEEIVRQPPWEIALAELAKLGALNPETRIELKHFYTRLSFILRKYFENLYEFPALENTTEELIGRLKRKKEFKSYFSTTRDFLSKSDLVKFAKYMPESFEKDREMKLVQQIVETTKPVVEEEDA